MTNINFNPVSYINKLWERFKKDSLFQNSVYLMSSTAVLAVLGFLFWIIIARAYPSDQIGIATALISATVLLSNFSMLGFNSAIIRYLPGSKGHDSLINSSIYIVVFASVIIALGYLLGIGKFTNQFDSLTANLGYSSLFIVFICMVSINTLTDSIFIAHRESRYNFIVYTCFGVTKLILPIFLISFGAYGIFFAYSGSVVIALLLSFYFIKKRYNYKFQFKIDKKMAKEMGRFSTASYLTAFLSGSPMLIMPTLIVSRLGSSQAAYYFLASTIVNVLYIIPQATTQSLFAEGSTDKTNVKLLVKSASKLVYSLLVPATLVLLLLGKYVLLIFGNKYSLNGERLLQIMSITGIFLSLNLIFTTVLKVQHQIKQMVLINLGYAVVTIGMTIWLLKYGIVGAGYALLIGQIFVCLEFLVLFLVKRYSVK